MSADVREQKNQLAKLSKYRGSVNLLSTTGGLNASLPLPDGHGGDGVALTVMQFGVLFDDTTSSAAPKQRPIR